MLLPCEVLIIPFIFLIKYSLEIFLLSSLILVLAMIFLNLCGVFTLELQVKSDRQLEVALDSAALVWAFKGVIDFNVNLRPVKGAISCVDRPWFTKLVQRLFKSSLSSIPEFIGAKPHLGPCRKL